MAGETSADERDTSDTFSDNSVHKHDVNGSSGAIIRISVYWT